MKSYRFNQSRPRRSLWRGWAMALPVLAVVAFGAGFISNVPDVQWRAMLLHARVRDLVFIRDEYLPTPVAPVEGTATHEPGLPTPTVVPTPTPLPPTPSPVPLPPSASLTGFRYEAQKPNACGPATLAVALSYFGWEGTQSDTLGFLKPKLWDKNVRPDEMVAFVETTGLGAVMRPNGDLELLKRFIAAGFPVIVQKGFWLGEKDGWLGHYEVVTAYDDAQAAFVAQDTFQGPNFEVTYAQMLEEWRAFNYTYIVIHRPDDVVAVNSLLGEAVDRDLTWARALDRAAVEAAASEGQARAFALFNQGTALVNLYRYHEAVLAFDEARRLGLPWRMLWYQTGPYKAYFYTGRYLEVISLADSTLARTGGLEESLYWRGQARQQIGEPEAAVADYREALKQNPNFNAAELALQYLGHTP